MTKKKSTFDEELAKAQTERDMADRAKQGDVSDLFADLQEQADIVLGEEGDCFRGKLLSKLAPQVFTKDDGTMQDVNIWEVETTDGGRGRLRGSIVLDQELERVLAQYELPVTFAVLRLAQTPIAGGHRLNNFRFAVDSTHKKLT